jgi:hypothetical protein
VTGNRIPIPRGPARQCTRCGALGTHYLTCPLLQLPRGYRFNDDQLLSTPFTAGKPPATRRTATDDVSSADAAIYRLPSQAGAAGPGRSAREQRPVTGHRLDIVS